MQSIIARSRYRQKMLSMSDHYKLDLIFAASSGQSVEHLSPTVRTRAFEAYVAAVAWDREDGYKRARKFIKKVLAAPLARSIERARQKALEQATRADATALEPGVEMEGVEATQQVTARGDEDKDQLVDVGDREMEELEASLEAQKLRFRRLKMAELQAEKERLEKETQVLEEKKRKRSEVTGAFARRVGS